jgi:hypothetical protein
MSFSQWQGLLGHAEPSPPRLRRDKGDDTEIYAHAAKIGNGKGVRSPLDALGAGM